MSINKHPSRLTLADLFGTENPTMADIEAVAQNTKNQAKRRKKQQPAGPEARRLAAERADRLAIIQATARALGSEPDTRRQWHPVGLVFIENLHQCACGTKYHSPANTTFLVEYLNQRDGTRHLLEPAGPIDYRLPRHSETHIVEVAVCGACFPHVRQPATPTQPTES